MGTVPEALACLLRSFRNAQEYEIIARKREAHFRSDRLLLIVTSNLKFSGDKQAAVLSSNYTSSNNS